MSYATNSFVKWLLARSYGQGGAVALPNSDSSMVPISRFPAGVQDVLNRLYNQCAEWPLPNGSNIEWCFLVGGPGNGKSEALRALAGALSIQLPQKTPGDPAPRSIPSNWPANASSIVSGLEIAFINDASIPRSEAMVNGQPGSLFFDLVDGINRFLVDQKPIILFANVNRGILVEEQAALQGALSHVNSIAAQIAVDTINWLVEPIMPSTSSSVAPSTIEVLVVPEPEKPYYGQIRILLSDQQSSYNIAIHTVFLDALSLLEPTPGVLESIDFTSGSPVIAPYQPFGDFGDEGSSRDQTIAGELLKSLLEAKNWREDGCVNHQDGTLCEAFASCPFAQNARWLQESTLRQRFLNTFRAAEIAAARRLTYRDILGYFSLALLGQPEQAWLSNTHPCQWIEGKIQTVASSKRGKKSAIADLINHRIYTNLFTISDLRSFATASPLQKETLYESIVNRLTLTGESPPSRSFERAFSDIDPSHDFDSWNGIRLKTLEAVESLEIVYPSDEVSKWSYLPAEVHSDIERALDQVIQGEIVSELGNAVKISREALSRVQFLRKWRSIFLLRQVGLALGQMTFRNVFVAWLAEQENALQNQEMLELGRGIETLILPAGKTEFLLAPLRPRTYNLSSDPPKNTFLVIIPTNNLRVWIVPQGDVLIAEIQLIRARERRLPERIASLVIDLPIAREALLHVNGKKASFTEIGDSAFARIERVLASLVGRDLMRKPTPYFTDELGNLHRIVKNSSGTTPLRSYLVKGENERI